MKIMYIRLSDEVIVKLTKKEVEKAFQSEEGYDVFFNRMRALAHAQKRTPFTEIKISLEKS